MYYAPYGSVQRLLYESSSHACIVSLIEHKDFEPLTAACSTSHFPNGCLQRYQDSPGMTFETTSCKKLNFKNLIFPRMSRFDNIVAVSHHQRLESGPEVNAVTFTSKNISVGIENASFGYNLTIISFVK